MLSDEQLNDLWHKAEILMDGVTDWLVADIVRRVHEAGQFTNSAEYDVWQLKQMGLKGSEISDRLNKELNISQAEANMLLIESSRQGYEMDVKRLGARAPAFKDNLYMQQLVNAELSASGQNISNLTGTIGFVTPYNVSKPLTQAYRETCNYAFQQTVTGATDLNTAVKNATRNLLRRGIQTIDYVKGKSVNAEVAVRRSILGAIGKVQEQISQHNHDELGASGWEISAHAASAPDHEPIQGRQYTDAAYTALNSSLTRPIGTLNCKHIAFPIIYGVTKPTYTAEELAKMKADNAKGVTVNGKHYSVYEATQQQRALERAIRAQKRNLIAAAASNDPKAVTANKARLTLLFNEYNVFSKAAGLQPQYSRFEIGKQVSAQLTAEERNALGL